MSRALLPLALAPLCLAGGCSTAESNDSSAGAVTHESESSVRPTAIGELATTENGADSRETWFAMYIEGVKVGYGRTATARFVDQGNTLNRIEEEVNFTVNRNGQRTEEKIASIGVETLAGELLRFQTEINSGQDPIRTKGEVQNGKMVFDDVHHRQVARQLDPLARQRRRIQGHRTITRQAADAARRAGASSPG